MRSLDLSYGSPQEFRARHTLRALARVGGLLGG